MADPVATKCIASSSSSSGGGGGSSGGSGSGGARVAGYPALNCNQN
jgi:hypothetical protein